MGGKTSGKDFSRLEITINKTLTDARGNHVKNIAKDYFGIELESVKSVRVLTADNKLSQDKALFLQNTLTDPVTEHSSYEPLFKVVDGAVWVGWKPGVKDNTGDVMGEMFRSRYPDDSTKFFSSDYFVLKPNKKLNEADLNTLGKEMSNFIVQKFKTFTRNTWGPEGIGKNIPLVGMHREPGFKEYSFRDLTLERLSEISDTRQLFMNPDDLPTIIKYFSQKDFITKRQAAGLGGPPTDVELEYIAQARSDHCNHNTFNGKFFYHDLSTGDNMVVSNLFKECIKIPTEKLAKELPFIKSILWDNAGVAEFNEKALYVVTGETHNSPSNMEAYGGAITGIVGIYRDPLGTGRGARLVGGAFGYCVGPRNYSDDFMPFLHPRQLQDGIILGVRDGGNKSGIPTVFGTYREEYESLGKSLVFVYAIGLMPHSVAGKPGYDKFIDPGDLIVMSGGRVGKDGIHGVTAASAGLDDATPAQHVQIGDPYTQKKMLDFLIEARDLGLINYTTDNGGGGLSSSVGEASRFTNTKGKTGAVVYLDRVSTKYEGMDQWEIWVSESQERMTLGVSPRNIEHFLELSRKHGVESNVIGEFNNSDGLKIQYNGKTSALIPTDLLDKSFPQWEFNATWVPPEQRGLKEPGLEEQLNYTPDLRLLLAQPNIASHEWIFRQYDHEVQGTSIIKPLTGVNNDIPSDAAVIRPDLHSQKGIAITQVVKQKLSKIDTYHMVTASMDEAVRRILAVGGTLKHLTGIDNFCWPTIIPRDNNPDAELNAAKLVRANWALRYFSNAFKIPLLSGKDSMYTDGDLVNSKTGERKRVYGLPTMQYTLHSVIDDVYDCISCDAKQAGNNIFLVGTTKNELGGSEYYKMKGHVGLNVPVTDIEKNLDVYRRFEEARQYADSVKAVADGGVAVALFQMALGGGIGASVHLNKMDLVGVKKNYQALFSESTGRFLVEVGVDKSKEFANIMGDDVRYIGKFMATPGLQVFGLRKSSVIDSHMKYLEPHWKKTHAGR